MPARHHVIPVGYAHLAGDSTPGQGLRAPAQMWSISPISVDQRRRARTLRPMRQISPRVAAMLRALATLDRPESRGAHSISVVAIAQPSERSLAAISNPI